MADTTNERGNRPGKGATMATFSISCPCCGTALVATDAGFSATTVEIAACPSQRANGTVSFTVRKSSLAYVADGTIAHRGGLVAFG